MSDGAAGVGVLDGDAVESQGPAFGVLDAVRGSIDGCSVPTGDRTAAEWMALVAECGRAMTVLSAARDAAMVRLAAIDEVVDDDGVVSEQVNGLGTVCVDAGSMVATATGCSPGFAEDLVDQAVIRVVRVPALHEAMLSGLLDDYSARCIASELADAPIDIARAVVDALAKDFGIRSGPALRRRTRELLFRLAPELLRKRIAAARKKIGLRRWVGEPGTDQWGGTFASERAAKAWATVDALAHRYRVEDTYPTLEMARAYALLDLVDGRASVTTVLSLTVPAGEVEDDDPATAGETADDAEVSRGRRRASAESMSGQPSRPRTRTRTNRSTDVAATARGSDEPTSGSLSRDDAVATREDDRFVAVSGAQGGSLTWVPVWALSLTGEPAGCRAATRTCHPLTGALIDPDDALATEAYTPGERLKRLIRARDGRCRFPGCTVPARSCDIDHVQAWPRGPTAAANLMCLCRRHHRVKQRMRWRVFIGVDATVTWTDPAGAVHITEPVDHLGSHEVRSTRLSDHARAEDGAPESEAAVDGDEPNELGELVGGEPQPTGMVPEPRPWLVSPSEALFGVLAEHPVAAAARELTDLRRHRRHQAVPSEDRSGYSGQCSSAESSVRRAGSRCGYVDLHPYVEGATVAVELDDEAFERHCSSSGSSGTSGSNGPAEDPPPF
jgi:hypothetical protein